MNELMIPDKSEVPAYILNAAAARAANEEAAAGISTGFPPRVKLSGKQFTLVDGNGEETPFPPNKMVQGPEGFYMPIVVLRAKKALDKTWYAVAFNPADEGRGPDCVSNDGERPDPTSLAPQSETCASCAMNAYGSGHDQAGNPTKGKACADTKVLAVFVPGCGPHSFKIPPASLKNWGLYVKQLTGAGIPVGNVKTLVGFDLLATFPILIFRFGGFLPEASMAKITEMAQSIEVEDIIGGVSVAPKQLAAPASPAAALPPPVDDMGLGDSGTTDAEKQAAEAAATAKAAKAAAAKLAKEAKETAAAVAKAAKEAKEEAARIAAANKVQEFDMDLGTEAEDIADANGVSDAELMAELGL